MTEVEEKIKSLLSTSLSATVIQALDVVIDPATMLGLSMTDIIDIYRKTISNVTAFVDHIEKNTGSDMAFDGIVDLLKSQGIGVPNDAQEIIDQMKEDLKKDGI